MWGRYNLTRFISQNKAIWKGSHNPILRGLVVTLIHLILSAWVPTLQGSFCSFPGWNSCRFSFRCLKAWNPSIKSTKTFMVFSVAWNLQGLHPITPNHKNNSLKSTVHGKTSGGILVVFWGRVLGICWLICWNMFEIFCITTPGCNRAQWRFSKNMFSRSQTKTSLGTVNIVWLGGFNPFEKFQSNWIISPSRSETKIFETTTQVNIVNGGGPSQPQTFCIHWRCELPSPTYLLLMSSSFNKEHGHSLLIASSLAIVAYCGHSCLSCILARYVTRLVSTDFSWRQLLDWNGCKNYMHN